jgi:hypothetical protein
MADIAKTLKQAGFKVRQAEGTKGIIVSLDNQRVSRQDVQAVMDIPQTKMTNVIVGKQGGIFIKA